MSRTRSRSGRTARAAGTATLAGALALAGVAACGSSSGGSPSSGGTSTSGGVTGTITVLAASSLTEAFTTLGKQFEAAYPGTTVKFSFAASSALAEQVTQGAPADVFASASTKNMDQVTSAGDATSPTNFVKNVMEIATPPNNPQHIAAVADLARAGVKVALCQAQVPCGATAAKVFANAKVTVKPVTQEPDVKSVLAKVTTGEVDAGVVYVTDVRSAGTKVTGVPIPDSVNASTEYPIAALTHAPNAAGARAFVAYVLSSAGQQVLRQDGFQTP
jgi:molybdate transport system substrate-binding protein